MRDIWLDALIRANKAGAKGQRVVGYLLPQTAMEDNIIKLVFDSPSPGAATEKPWYDE